MATKSVINNDDDDDDDDNLIVQLINAGDASRVIESLCLHPSRKEPAESVWRERGQTPRVIGRVGVGLPHYS